MRRSFDDLRRGRPPSVPLLEVGCPSVVDPTRAPEGRAVMHMLGLTTRNLADGGPSRWRSIQDDVADAWLGRLGAFTRDARTPAVRARALVTPLDHELSSRSFVGGDYTGLAQYSHQTGAARPTPALSGYRVPGLGGLYLTGPFMHPGGGVVGGGRATAVTMVDDLGLDPAVFTGRRGPSTMTGVLAAAKAGHHDRQDQAWSDRAYRPPESLTEHENRA